MTRTIRADMRLLAATFAPLRLTKDWASFKEQFSEIVALLDRETDYEQEAANQREARALFEKTTESSCHEFTISFRRNAY